jgi:saccharopine dehydrogenase (NADP+, L-glutamate forming)
LRRTGRAGSDDNPWGYKFSWNPRNVVLAGRVVRRVSSRMASTATSPITSSFRRTVSIAIPGGGVFDGYANRDSLKYRSLYGLDDIPTLVRGTLRKQGYCQAWDAFVQLGCTDDGYAMELDANATWSDYLNAFLPPSPRPVRDKLADYLGLDPKNEVMAKLDWLGLFSDQPIGVGGASPAATLQHLLEQKWKLGPTDKDMVVMWHRFRYAIEGMHQELQASLVVIGQDPVNTAMASTVGLPVAMAAKLVLNGKVSQRGVLLPIAKELYEPILTELEKHGVIFKEEEVEA